MTYSIPARRNLLATSPDEPMLELAEITHKDLAVPIRVVNDTVDIVVNGETFVACPFTLSRPDDVDQQTPTAKISVDNIGRELTQWLEMSNGGKGAKLRLMAVLRSSNEEYSIDYFAQDYTKADNPDVEFDMTMDLSGLSINNLTVDGSLGFKNSLMQPAVAVRYDPFTSPGLF